MDLNFKPFLGIHPIIMHERKLDKKDCLESDAIHFDFHKCTGCKVCELVCSFHHHNFMSTSFTRIHIFNDLFFGRNKAYFCLQCTTPQCYHACPKNAIYFDELTGAKIIDPKICDSCGKCAIACPFNKEGFVLRKTPDEQNYIKCDLCGGTPQCVEWCAPKALSYIKRGEIK
jgi:anaerobic carbon-monoxide dehydrogenase iron sulfur subunit